MKPPPPDHPRAKAWAEFRADWISNAHMYNVARCYLDLERQLASTCAEVRELKQQINEMCTKAP